MSTFKLPSKFTNKSKTIINYTFDDSVYGHEIKDEWGFSMIDAMCYCGNREKGYSAEECYQIFLKYREEEMKKFEELW